MSRIFNRSENTHMFSVSWADKIAANFLNPMRAFEKAFNYAKARGIDPVPPAYVIVKRRMAGLDQSWVVQDLNQWLRTTGGIEA